MKKDRHSIDKLFKDAIDGQGETPPQVVWDAIEKKLDQHRAVDFNKKYLRLKRVAILLIALLIGAGVYTFKTWKTVNNRETADIVQQNTIAKIIIPAGKPAETTAADVLTATSGSKGKGRPEMAGGMMESNVQPAHSNIAGQESIVNPGTEDNHQTRGHVANAQVILYTKKQIVSIGDAQVSEMDNRSSFNAGIEPNAPVRLLADLPVLEPALLKAGAAMDLKKIVIGNKQLLTSLINRPLAKKEVQAKKDGYFTATVFYSPNISVNHIKAGKIQNMPARNVDDREQIKRGEHFQFSTTVGVLADYHINRHWAVQSGISLSSKSIHINPKTIYAGVDYNGSVKYLYNCSSGYLFLSPKSSLNPAVGDSLQAFDSKNFLQYLSLPLIVKYTYPLKKLSLFLSAGGAINMLTKNKIKTAVSDGQLSEVSINDRINGLQKRYFGISISMGASYDLTDKIAVSFLPSYNFAITSLTSGAAVKTYPDTIGFGAGITYKL